MYTKCEASKKSYGMTEKNIPKYFKLLLQMCNGRVRS